MCHNINMYEEDIVRLIGNHRITSRKLRYLVVRIDPEESLRLPDKSKNKAFRREITNTRASISQTLNVSELSNLGALVR
eukprot:12182714-Heterocapsa_arctica.AAC.1